MGAVAGFIILIGSVTAVLMLLPGGEKSSKLTDIQGLLIWSAVGVVSGGGSVLLLWGAYKKLGLGIWILLLTVAVLTVVLLVELAVVTRLFIYGERHLMRVIAWSDRRIRQFARWANAKRLTALFSVTCATASAVITYQPHRMLMRSQSNGIWDNSLTRQPVIRMLADNASSIANGPFRILVLPIKIAIALALLPVILLISIVTSPRALKSILFMVTLPVALGLMIWSGIQRELLPQRLKQMRPATAMSFVSVMTFLIIASVVKFMDEEKAVRLIGEMRPNGYIVALGVSSMAAVYLGASHFDGTRKLPRPGSVVSSTGDMHIGMVAVTSMTAIIMMLMIARFNRRIFARMRLMDPWVT